MVVLNFLDQLQLDRFALTLHHLIDNRIDLSAFYEKYKNDGGGRSAYDPAILLKLVLFAYSKGIHSPGRRDTDMGGSRRRVSKDRKNTA
jgi:hypothetical protein